MEATDKKSVLIVGSGRLAHRVRKMVEENNPGLQKTGTHRSNLIRVGRCPGVGLEAKIKLPCEVYIFMGIIGNQNVVIEQVVFKLSVVQSLVAE